jgi:Ser/Thr protein kinase RdoA (MazF antagonist)
LPEQVCIRDVRSAHVLFTGDRVSGIVDFDAMQMTSVAVDVARLLGSYVADDYGRWQHGIDAYSAIRPLSPDERRAARVLDQLGVLGAGLSWLKWILLERRQFEVPQVLARLAVTERRLEHLSGRLRSSGGRIAVDL